MLRWSETQASPIRPTWQVAGSFTLAYPFSFTFLSGKKIAEKQNNLWMRLDDFSCSSQMTGVHSGFPVCPCRWPKLGCLPAMKIHHPGDDAIGQWSPSFLARSTRAHRRSWYNRLVNLPGKNIYQLTKWHHHHHHHHDHQRSDGKWKMFENVLYKSSKTNLFSHHVKILRYLVCQKCLIGAHGCSWGAHFPAFFWFWSSLNPLPAASTETEEMPLFCGFKRPVWRPPPSRLVSHIADEPWEIVLRC